VIAPASSDAPQGRLVRVCLKQGYTREVIKKVLDEEFLKHVECSAASPRASE